MTATGNPVFPAVPVLPDCSALVTISTPDSPTPICRLGTCQQLLGDLTVRQLLERVISPGSLLSVRIPMTQLEAESPAAVAINELLKADSCEVVFLGDGARESRTVALDEPAAAITHAQVGAQGSSFLNLALEVRPAPDTVAPAGADRRQVALPEVMEAEVQAASALSAEQRRPPAYVPEVFELPVEESGQETSPVAGEELTPQGAEESVAVSSQDSAESLLPPESAVGAHGIVAIVAEPPPKRQHVPSEGRKEYIRKGDWLRAQFLPEIQALDFSGLFVGNLGLGVREERTRRNVVLADPARITDILLRGNSYRRSEDHAKALICYQELVDMDPGNADFRFLLGKTLLALGQQGQAVEALTRAKELGHEGARKELVGIKPTAARARRPLGFLRFWR